MILTREGKRVVARGDQLRKGPFDYRNVEMLAPTEGEVMRIEDQAIAIWAKSVLEEMRIFKGEHFNFLMTRLHEAAEGDW